MDLRHPNHPNHLFYRTCRNHFKQDSSLLIDSKDPVKHENGTKRHARKLSKNRKKEKKKQHMGEVGCRCVIVGSVGREPMNITDSLSAIISDSCATDLYLRYRYSFV